MAQSNGHDDSPANLPPGYTAFKIGGEDVLVPPMTLWAVEILQPELAKISPDLSWVEYAKVVLRIVATCLEDHKAGADEEPKQENIDATYNKLRRRCIVSEMRTLAGTMDSLLANSGFLGAQTEETQTQTENPGTGMSTVSAPTSPSEGSAEATPSGSSDALH